MITSLNFMALAILIISCNNPSEQPAKDADNSETINEKNMGKDSVAAFFSSASESKKINLITKLKNKQDGTAK